MFEGACGWYRQRVDRPSGDEVSFCPITCGDHCAVLTCDRPRLVVAQDRLCCAKDCMCGASACAVTTSSYSHPSKINFLSDQIKKQHRKQSVIQESSRVLPKKGVAMTRPINLVSRSLLSVRKIFRKIRVILTPVIKNWIRVAFINRSSSTKKLGWRDDEVHTRQEIGAR